LRVRPLNGSNGRNVTVSFSWIDGNAIASITDNLVVNQVHIQAAADRAGFRALDDSDRSFLPVGSSAERQDCLSIRNRYNDFIMDGVVSDVVHRSRKFAGLTVK